MSKAIWVSPSIRVLRPRPRNPIEFPRAYCESSSISGFKSPSLVSNSIVFANEINGYGGKFSALISAWSEEGSLKEVDDPPVLIELLPICSESHFDRVLEDAQQLEESVVIVWMAKWCRKCIYLKPKLEKLAADYHPRLRFYCVDVNTVPHKLVVHAGVTKMPTIQLWKDGKKQCEVIGGHKAHIVINEVREMIETQVTL